MNLTDDTIDVSDLTERVDELEEERDDNVLGCPDGSEIPDPIGWAKDNPEDAAELMLLTNLLDELKGYGGDGQWRGDWYPATLISRGYFKQAMDEMVADIGEMPKNIPSYMTITLDYKALQSDYSSVEFGGETYWYR